MLYATSPVKQIVGYFTVKNIVSGTPASLWNQFSEGAGIASQDFYQYYQGSSTGVAIEIGAAVVFEPSISIAALLGNSTIPQSFRYLDVFGFAIEKICPHF